MADKADDSFPWLDEDERVQFPDANKVPGNEPALAGGNLSPGLLLSAYEQGYFPWFNPGDPILWWSLDPRFTISPEDLHVGGRLRRYLRNSGFSVTSDLCFERVIRACSEAHGDSWIDDRMLSAYLRLHELGYAHSVEIWKAGLLAGGLYGVRVGRVFAGESMFSLQSNASKAAFVALAKLAPELGISLVDSQMKTSHMQALGGQFMRRRDYLQKLGQGLSAGNSKIWNAPAFGDFDLRTV